MTHLVAHVANAHLSQPEVLFDVAHEINGEWYTNSERQVWPFATLEVDFNPSIPKGWIEHLHAEAAHYAAKRPSPKEDSASGTSLLASLGLPTKVHSSVSGKLTRRI
jgi:hypothetical protein